MNTPESDNRYGPEPTREEIDRLPGAVVLAFGTNWCGYCRAIEPYLNELMPSFPDVRLLKVEDGSGRPLGRSFRVKLWPTLIFLRDGEVVQTTVRPQRDEILAGLERIGSATH